MFVIPAVLEATQLILGDILLVQFFVKVLFGLFLKDTLPGNLSKSDFNKMYTNPVVAFFFYGLYCMQFDKNGHFSTIFASVLAISELLGKTNLGWASEWILSSAGFLGGWFLVAAVIVMAVVIFAHISNYMITGRYLGSLKKYQVRSEGIPEASIVNYWKSVSAKHKYFSARHGIIKLVRSFKQIDTADGSQARSQVAVGRFFSSVYGFFKFRSSRQGGIADGSQDRLQAAVDRFLRAVDTKEFIEYHRSCLNGDAPSGGGPTTGGGVDGSSLAFVGDLSGTPGLPYVAPARKNASNTTGSSSFFTSILEDGGGPFVHNHQSFKCHLSHLVKEVKAVIDDRTRRADVEQHPSEVKEFLSQLESASFFLLPLQRKIISAKRDPSDSCPLKITKERLQHVKERIDQLEKTTPSFTNRKIHARRIKFFNHMYGLICDYYESDMGRGYRQMDPIHSSLVLSSRYAFVLQSLVEVVDQLNPQLGVGIDPLENIFDLSDQAAFYSQGPNIQIKQASRILYKMVGQFSSVGPVCG